MRAIRHVMRWLAWGLCLGAGASSATTVTFTASGTWTAPAGVTSVTVEAWGGGGAGGGATVNPSKGGGGAGGQYASKVVTVTPGSTYTVTVGAGGTGSTGNGTAGGDSSFATTSVVAKGGAGGVANGAAGAGSSAGGVGSTVFAGGSGSNGFNGGVTTTGGAGGGGAGSSGAGGNASGNTAGTGTATGGGAGGAGRTTGGNGNAGTVAGGGGGGGYATNNTARSGGNGASGQVVLTYTALPAVVSIDRASFDPTAVNKAVSWTVTFNQSVTGVDASDFTLVQAGGVTGASITSVTGSGTTWTVNANTGTGTTGTLRLDLVDNDSIDAGGVPLGGAGTGNGNFTGQFYTLLASVCTGAADIVFCDDFERSNPGTVGNGWTVTPANVTNCTGTAGNTGCAGIDSDIPPFNVYSNPRANPTRSMFTRWSIVSVDSPVINLGGKTGAHLSFWIRRGHDSFSECPEAVGENYLVQYYASDGTWKTLAQYPSSPSAALCDGAIFTPTIELPADALHANFKLRFYQPGGSGKTGSGGAPGVVGYDYWHMDDVVVKATTAPTYTGAFCDNFEGGLARWSITAEGVPAGANIGDARIGSMAYQSASHELDMRWGYVVASTFKTDLTGVSGNITYWVRSGTTTALDPVTNENLVVEYLNSSGVWTNLATYLGSAAAGTIYNGSHALPADAQHADFRLRFRQLAGSGYDKSYWHIDDVCVGNLLPTADLALSKTGGTLVPGSNTSYTLRVTNNGPGTLSGSMQIVDTLPNGLSYLAGNGTGWVCSAVNQAVTCNWAGTLASGAVAPDLVLTVAVGAGVSGSVTNTATVTGTVNDPVPGNNTSSYTSGNFMPAFIFTDRPCVNGIAIGQPGQTCSLVNWSPQVAGQAKTGIYITAVNALGVPTQLSASSASTVGFQFGMVCHDPVANAGVQATFSAASPATLPLCTGNAAAAPTTWTATTNLSFAAGQPSVATPFTFNYADVGEVELFLRNAAATSQLGMSGNFVVKPAGFVLSAIKCTLADAANCGAGALAMPTVGDNPGAANAAGPAFIRAGIPFSVTVTAVAANGSATPNYGKEVTPESVMLTPTNVVAGMITPPAIGGSFGAFTGGVASGTAFTWDEVGIITLTPSVKDGNYLGAGDITGTPSGNVGRFYPDHFDTVVTQLNGVPMNCPDASCPAAFNGMVYAGQPFGLSVTAMNASGGITVNYNALTGFSRTTALNAFGALGSTALPSGAGALGVTSLAAAAFSAGVATTANESYTFSATPTAPTNIYIRATDGETTSLRTVNPTTASVEGGVQVVSGRIKIPNAHGSELLKLPFGVTVQYWNGSRWVTSTTDSSTTFTSANIAFANCQKNLSTGAAPPANCKAAVAVDAATSPVIIGNGIGSFQLNAPGAGNTGSADLTINAPAYLPSTTARATFGIFKGAAEYIYIRENY